MNEPIGIFSLMRIDQDNGVIEVGNVIFSIALQGARMSTEAYQLLASYVFDELQYRRYEWKCDALKRPLLTFIVKTYLYTSPYSARFARIYSR